VGLNLDYKTLMGRGKFGDVLLVVWMELKRQVVKIMSKVDKARFQWLVFVITVYYNIMIRYILTAIGLTPGGSNTVHIYTQTIHRTTQSTQNNT
jgi:hypothetical protein